MASAVVGTLRVLLDVNAAHFASEFNKAEVKVGSFDKLVSNTSRSLTRMVEQFSGQRIVAEAAKMAAAVEKVGGVSALTERELSRVASTVNEATAKLRAMGAEVPPSIAKLSTELKTLGTNTTVATGATGGFAGAMRMLGPILPIASVAGLTTAVIGLAKQSFDAASQITDLANKTGLSTDAIQRMRAVADQTGTSVEAFTSAAFKLGVNVSEGTTKARKAVEELGLEYGRLKAMKPEEQFATVVKALEGVDSAQERNRLGTALFGKQFSEVAASIEDGYSRIADAASVSTDAQLQALDRAGDAWSKFKADVSASISSVLGTIVIALQEIERGADSMTVGQKAWLFATQGAGGYREELQRVGRELIAAEKGQKDIRLSTEGATAATVDYVAQLAAAKVEVAELSSVQRTQLNAALKVGAETAKEYAESIELSDLALKLYQEQQRGTTRTTRELKVATEELLKTTRTFNADVKAITIPGNVQWLATMARLAPSLSDAAAKTDILDATLPPLASDTAIATRGFEEFKGAVDAAGKAGATTGGLFSAIGANLQSVFANLPQLLSQAFAGGGGLAGGFKALGVQLADAIAQPIFKKLAELKDSVGRIALSFKAGAAAGLTAGLGAAIQGGSWKSQLGQVGLAAAGVTAAAAVATGATVASVAALGAMTLGVGAAVVGVGLLIRHFYGVSKEIKEAQKNAKEFQEELWKTLTPAQILGAQGRPWAATMIKVRDAYLAIGLSAAEAERAVAALLDTRNPAQSAAAIAEITAVLQEQERQLQINTKEANKLFDQILQGAEDWEGIPDFMRPEIERLLALGLLTEEQAEKLRGLGDAGATNWAKVKEAADKYGVRLESLGGAFNAQRIQTDATGIIHAFNRMTDAGADVGGVLFDMQDEISAVVNDSKKFGTTIPANMKPWITELHRVGMLVDANGDKITDLGDIKYGEAIKTEAEIAREGWDRILSKIQELIDKIAGPLAGAIDNIADSDVTVRVGVEYDDPGFIPRGSQDDFRQPREPDEGFAAGTFGRLGRWFGQFGAQGTDTRLHNMEAVITPPQRIPFAMDVLRGLNVGNLLAASPAMPSMPALDSGGNREAAAMLAQMSQMYAAFQGALRTFERTLPITISDAVKGVV